MEVHEFSQMFFEPRFGLRMLGFLGLYRSLYQEVAGPVAVTGPGEPEIQLHDIDADKEIVVAVRPREKGYSARISFCCSSDHGFNLSTLESTLGVTVKIEPKAAGCHMVRLLVDHTFDPFTPEMLEFLQKTQDAYKGLRSQA